MYVYICTYKYIHIYNSSEKVFLLFCTSLSSCSPPHLLFLLCSPLLGLVQFRPGPLCWSGSGSGSRAGMCAVEVKVHSSMCRNVTAPLSSSWVFFPSPSPLSASPWRRWTDR